MSAPSMQTNVSRENTDGTCHDQLAGKSERTDRETRIQTVSVYPTVVQCLKGQSNLPQQEIH